MPHNLGLRRSPPVPAYMFFSALRAAPSPSQPRRYLYGYARQALRDAYVVLGLKEGDEILYPDYICDVTMAPCHQLGLQVRFYPVLDDFQPDWEALEISVTEKTRAVLMVHYFGFPQELNQWMAFAQAHGLWLVEDNAQGYGSTFQGLPLGRWGHVGVVSMRKVMPLLNGACLWVNDPRLNPILDARKMKDVGSPCWRKVELTQLCRILLSWLKVPYNKFLAPRLHEEMPASQEYQYLPGDMDSFSKRLLSIGDMVLDSYQARRREIYLEWLSFAKSHGLAPVFPRLPAGVSPQVFPCYAADYPNRQKWLAWAWRHAVDICPWPGLPMAVRRQHKLAVERWRRLLCFPIHQFMEVKEIRRIPSPT